MSVSEIYPSIAGVGAKAPGEPVRSVRGPRGEAARAGKARVGTARVAVIQRLVRAVLIALYAGGVVWAAFVLLSLRPG